MSSFLYLYCVCLLFLKKKGILRTRLTAMICIRLYIPSTAGPPRVGARVFGLKVCLWRSLHLVLSGDGARRCYGRGLTVRSRGLLSDMQ